MFKKLITFIVCAVSVLNIYAASYKGVATGVDLDRTHITTIGQAQADKVMVADSNLEFRGMATIGSTNIDTYRIRIYKYNGETNVVGWESPLNFSYTNVAELMENIYEYWDKIETNIINIGILNTNVDAISNSLDIVILDLLSVSNTVTNLIAEFIGVSNDLDQLEFEFLNHQTNIDVHEIAAIVGLQDVLDSKAGTSAVAQVATDLSAHELKTGTEVHGLGTMSTQSTADYYTKVEADNLLDEKVRTNDTGELDFTGANILIPDATISNQPVTKSQKDALRLEIYDLLDSFKSLRLYSTRDAHPTIAGTYSLSDTVVPNYSVTNSYSPNTTNILSTFFYTNKTDEIKEDGYEGWMYAKKSSGNSDAQIQMCLIYTDDDGITTNFIDSTGISRSIRSDDIEPYGFFGSNPSNIQDSTTNLIVGGCVRIIVGGGAGATIISYGGNDYPSHISLPGLGVSAGYITSETLTNSGVYISMTNFVAIDSSSNYLVYDPNTRILTGCVTNSGSGGLTEDEIRVLYPLMTNRTSISLGYQAYTNEDANSHISIGRAANGKQEGVAIGQQAYAYQNGVAIGLAANGYSDGIGIGVFSDGGADGIGIGFYANGRQEGVAIGYQAKAPSNGVAVGAFANAISNSAAIGYGITNSIENTTRIKGRLDLNNDEITNVNAITLGGDRRTNWPPASSGDNTTNTFTPNVLVSAPTVTITKASTKLIELWVTNESCEISIQTNDWTTNDYASINLQLWADTNSISFPTNIFHEANIPASLSTNDVETLLLEKRKWDMLWYIYQME